MTGYKTVLARLKFLLHETFSVCCEICVNKDCVFDWCSIYVFRSLQWCSPVCQKMCVWPWNSYPTLQSATSRPTPTPSYRSRLWSLWPPVSNLLSIAGIAAMQVCVHVIC